MNLAGRPKQIWLAGVIAMLMSMAFPCLAWAVNTYAIYSMKLDGSDRRLVYADPNMNFGSVDVSPDGKMVIFDSWPLTGFDPTTQQSFACNIDGSNFRAIAKGGMPKWSPDGRTIAFQDYTTGVAVIDIDGTGKETVAMGRNNPNWLSSYELAILQSARSIQILDLQTGQLRPATGANATSRYGYAISLNKSRLSYTTGTETSKLIVSWMSGDKKTLYTGAIPNGVAWHPNGKLVAFAVGYEDLLDLKNGKPPSQLQLADADTGTVEAIPGQDKSKIYMNPCFSPDGQRIYFSSTVR